MEKVLNQEEIDALFRAARGMTTAEPPIAAALSVEPWNLHEAGRLRKDQLHSISQLHESFARNLSHSLGAYLRAKFEVALVSVEQLAYREFLSRVPDLTYYASLHLDPADQRGGLQLDQALAFPIVDLLLGGTGKSQSATREVTEIEELILEGVGQIICHELQAVWQPLGVQFAFEQRQAASQMLRVMPPEEKTLALSFEVTLPELRGALNLVFPAVVSSALLRKISTEWVYQRPRTASLQQDTIKKRLLEATVLLELATPPLNVKLTELLSLHPGSVLPLRRSVDEPVTLRLGRRDCWTARPVRAGSRRRGAHVMAWIPQPEELGP